MGDNGVDIDGREYSLGDVGIPLSSTFCDEKDGPNAVSNASAEGAKDSMVVLPLRGERGSLLSDRGLFTDDAIMNPDTCDDDVDPPPIPTLEEVVSCHSLDLAVLIPRL